MQGNRLATLDLSASFRSRRVANYFRRRGKGSSFAFDRALLVAVLGEIPEQRAAAARDFRCLETWRYFIGHRGHLWCPFQSRHKVTRLAEACRIPRKEFGTRLAFTLQSSEAECRLEQMQKEISKWPRRKWTCLPGRGGSRAVKRAKDRLVRAVAICAFLACHSQWSAPDRCSMVNWHAGYP